MPQLDQLNYQMLTTVPKAITVPLEQSMLSSSLVALEPTTTSRVSVIKFNGNLETIQNCTLFAEPDEG